jgi:DNA-nicking Smr family endonuclease
VSKKPRDLTAEEKTLWRRVAASVKPRRPSLEAKEDEALPTVRSAPRPPAKTNYSPKAHVPKAPAAAPPANRSAEKRVRRGKLEIGASLDLHGHHQDSGRAAVLRFLHAAQMRGDRTVIVITGAGRSGQGVLKQRLPEWLAAADLKPVVSGYAPAHRMHGGAGAFYVFLKRRTRD